MYWKRLLSGVPEGGEDEKKTGRKNPLSAAGRWKSSMPVSVSRPKSLKGKTSAGQVGK